MKSEFKKRSISRKIVVPVVAFGIIAIATLTSANMANAEQAEQAEQAEKNSQFDETMVEKISTRFGLNETEVQDTFQEFRSEREEQRHQHMVKMLEKNLENSVKTGDLTSDQMYAILEKHDELEDRYDDLYNLSPEDAHEARADMHEEMEAWALENDIDMSQFERFAGGNNGEERGEMWGHDQGMMMRRF